MEEIINAFPGAFRPFCRALFEQGAEPEEIRLRVGQPVMALGKGGEYFWSRTRGLFQGRAGEGYFWKDSDMKETLNRMSQYSMYALEEEIREGFFTIRGGHRVGVVGKAVCEKGQIVAIRSICGLNVRVARQKRGCARDVLPWLITEKGIYNTLILSPPGVGKTTMLRDCIRLLSEGAGGLPGQKVGLVDERSEVAACYFGVPQNDLGCRTDVLDACTKAVGMRLLVRSMSPQVLAVDELGTQEDCQAVEEALHCGCRILGTMHLGGMEEWKDKAYLSQWIERGFFERFVFLQSGAGGKREFSVYDGKRQKLC